MAIHFRRRLLEIAVALGAIAGAGLLDAGNVATAAQGAPWCAYLGGFGGGFDCSYYTFDQCMATARGLGGRCQPNPSVAQSPYRPQRRARRQGY
jgi:hypothetical protein